ncbi:pineal opsin-like [Ischnura elegans]|uniref:pineal opsin-like n=1 Tax=Ischnura elegans TaxID=197161 RepID=UPI001ED87032|nr:pineal opsin-like [Ischnura elegans]
MVSPWETGSGADGADGGGRGQPPGAVDEASDEERLLMSPGAYAAAAVALLLIGLVGFISNLLVMILMCKNKQLWTPLNAILFNLVCSDFSVSVLGNPITLTAALFRRWIFGRTVCVIYGFFMSLLGIASITTLMVLSFERYVMISKPFHVRRLSQKGALALIGAIWVYSLVLTMPPLFGWGDYVNESANISCSVNWESKTMSATTYIIFLFAMGLVVPVTVICFSYMNIIWTMKKNAITMGRVTKAETRVAFMVFVMIVAFLVAWTPYSVLALLVAFGDASLVSPGVAVVPALMAKSSICYNPVIYVGLNTQFRSAWHKLLRVRAVSETSQEVGGEHTAMLSPSHYMSHTLLEGGAGGNAATGTTSASGVLIYNSSNSPSKSGGGGGGGGAPKRRPLAVSGAVGANGEATRPSPLASLRATKISDAVLEEDDAKESDAERRSCEEECGKEESTAPSVVEEKRSNNNSTCVSVGVPVTAVTRALDDGIVTEAVVATSNGSRLPGGSGVPPEVADVVRVGGKGKRLRGGGFPRGGKGRKVSSWLSGEAFRGPRRSASVGASRGDGNKNRSKSGGKQFFGGGKAKVDSAPRGGEGRGTKDGENGEGEGEEEEVVEMMTLSVKEPAYVADGVSALAEDGDVVSV